MSKFLSFLDKHKKKIIILTIVMIILIISVVSLYKIYQYLTPDHRASSYGDRCEETESILITDERKKSVQETVESYEKMKLSVVDVKCNLIDIVIYVEEDVPLKTVKEMSKKLLEVFTEEELKYYEIELLVDVKDVEDHDIYPVAPKKAKGSSSFVW